MQKKIKSYFDKNKWILLSDDIKAKKKFKFGTFTQAFTWMTEVAFEAEKLDHHPDWTNVYNSVDVLLSTHDIGKLSEKDVLLAKFMDNIFDKFN